MKQRGFTIVEIVIVLVVVGILATIGGLAWHTAQQNAADSQAKSQALLLKDAIERYYADNGEYPRGVGCGTGWEVNCPVGKLASNLVPKYLPNIPEQHGKHKHSYVANFSRLNASSPDRYAVSVHLSTGLCKTGKNMASHWLNNAPDCNF